MGSLQIFEDLCGSLQIFLDPQRSCKDYHQGGVVCFVNTYRLESDVYGE